MSRRKLLTTLCKLFRSFRITSLPCTDSNSFCIVSSEVLPVSPAFKSSSRSTSTERSLPRELTLMRLSPTELLFKEVSFPVKRVSEMLSLSMSAPLPSVSLDDFLSFLFSMLINSPSDQVLKRLEVSSPSSSPVTLLSLPRSPKSSRPPPITVSYSSFRFFPILLILMLLSHFHRTYRSHPSLRGRTCHDSRQQPPR